ncbi:MAG: hypothetical protein P4L64_09355 [Caulobacteraceae bacterium]|nr:hypothetical protein [Caulobacteraceae bacterium]
MEEERVEAKNALTAGALKASALKASALKASGGARGTATGKGERGPGDSLGDILSAYLGLAAAMEAGLVKRLFNI